MKKRFAIALKCVAGKEQAETRSTKGIIYILSHPGSANLSYDIFSKICKLILDEGDKNEINIPSACKKVKVKARYGDPIGLTVKQFFEFYKLDLSAHKELERTRNLFVFGVSIGGPRHGDLKRLGDSLRRFGFNLHSNSISFFEGKTGNAHNEISVQ